MKGLKMEDDLLCLSHSLCRKVEALSPGVCKLGVACDLT